MTGSVVVTESEATPGGHAGARSPAAATATPAATPVPTPVPQVKPTASLDKPKTTKLKTFVKRG